MHGRAAVPAGRSSNHISIVELVGRVQALFAASLQRIFHSLFAIFTTNEFTGFQSRYLTRRVFIPWNIMVLTEQTCKLQNVSLSLCRGPTRPGNGADLTVNSLAWRLAILPSNCS